jgi:cold shock CspA family protein
MRQVGKIRSWNDDRGFGFIAPTGGGPELFFHITALLPDGSRPTVGESVSYELGRGKDGKPQAVRVLRQALGDPASYPTRRPTRAGLRRSPLAGLIGVVVLVALGVYGYGAYRGHIPRSDATPGTPPSKERKRPSRADLDTAAMEEPTARR